MNKDAAETIALQALGFIASDPDNLQRMMASTGIDANSLKSAASNADLLVGVLDFLLLSDEQTLAFCDHIDLAPDLPGRAWSTLTRQDMP